jgi:4-diphosphocytidyl-2-C-methyl-D-erythritol kinase
MIHEFAAAKINLALHVTGQRPDGYHLLDTLVTFADIGDRLRFEAADQDGFVVSGRFGNGLPVDAEAKTGNLVLRARDALRTHAEAIGAPALGARIHLEKNLPVASGIGGGSADAAAALRGLSRLWKLDIPAEKLRDIALSLGADVPMCLESRPLVARGIGEEIRALDQFPTLDLLLINPLVEVSTPVIFKSLASKNNPPLDLPGEGAVQQDWLSALVKARNDLQPPAEILEARISEAIGLLRATDPLFVRMSGSGATCFGVYADRKQCEAARSALEAARPGWYVEAARSR